MLIKEKRGWEQPGRAITPESVFWSRRAIMQGAAMIGAGAGLASLGAGSALAADAVAPVPGIPASAYRFKPGRALTPERVAETYNNFYEFSTDKDMWRLAQKFPQRPWSISFGGMVEKPFTIGIDDLLKQVTIEERIYRHRCVETWAMTVPWTGFPLADLVRLAQPLGSAKYLVFQTVVQDDTMPGVHSPLFTWPYQEGVTIQEAMADIAFLSTGLYGKPLPPQNGGPIRLVVPWKYGFKSAKSLIKITLSEKRPTVFWQSIQPREYGFWANVNPDVPHPRWSQASERLLGSNERVPTQIYNGYGAFVASLYADRMKEPLFM